MNKKRIVCALLSVMLLNLIASTAVAARPVDVPVDHWAYHAVSTALSRDFLSLFEDGTFKGSEKVDRYTLANVIYLLLEEIQVAEIKKTSAELMEIRDLSLRLEKDLGVWYADREALQDELRKIKEGAIAADERLSRVVESQQTSTAEQDRQIKDLQSQLAAIDFNIDEIIATLDGIGIQIKGHQDTLGDKGELLDDLVDALVILHELVYEHEVTLEDLELQLGNLATEKTLGFAQLEEDNLKFAEQITALDSLNKQLETDLRTLAALLRQEGQKTADLSSQLANTQASLAAMEESIFDKSAMEEVRHQVSADMQAQINSALIREQRLERQIKELEEEFEAYRTSSEKDIKASKTMTMVAIALAAMGAVVGLISTGN